MKSKQTFFLLGALLAVGIVTSGCSGVNHTQGISPATFLLPGMGQAAPEVQSPFTSDHMEAAEPVSLVRAH